MERPSDSNQVLEFATHGYLTPFLSVLNLPADNKIYFTKENIELAWSNFGWIHSECVFDHFQCFCLPNLTQVWTKMHPPAIKYD